MTLLARLAAAFSALRAGWMTPFTHSTDPDEPSQRQFLLGYGFDSAETAMQVSALSACVRLISGSTAKLPFPAYRRVGEEGRKRDRDHPVDRLLNHRPNRWQTAFEFRRMLTAHVALHGNGVALKKRVGAEITDLVPWNPSQVTMRQEETGQPPTYELRDKNGKGRVYPASDILHLRDLTLDGVIGLSRIEQARQGIALSMAAEQFGTSYFANGAEIGLAITADKFTPAQIKELGESIDQRHGGPRKAHKPLIVGGTGTKIQQLASSNKDSQMLELRSFQVEDIARLYGVPAHLIGLTEKQTSYGTGVEHMALGFLQFSLLDWLVMWETAVARDLLVETVDRNIFVEHMVDGLLRADFQTRMNGYAQAITNGVLNPNEARKKENLPPYEGGDEFWRPSNMSKATDPTVTPAEERGPRTLPSARPEHVWRSGFKKALRIVGEREVA